MNYKAVIWDFGGVITSSPFEAFNKFELDNNLPKDIIRTINLKLTFVFENLAIVAM